MKFIKLSLLLALTILMSFSCDKKKYPNLEKGMYAEIQTVKGDILMQLEFEKTPMTVANFVSLAEGTNTYVEEKHKGKKFYDGLKFHRVIAKFMIQGGDPNGNGSGNPGYKFKDEFDDSLVHDKAGILSMANSGTATNGSQFFITHNATPHLNNKHTVFGHVIIGQEIVDSIAKNDVITKVTIIRKGKDAKKFDAVKVFDTLYKGMAEEAKIAKAKSDAAAKIALEKQKEIVKIMLEKESTATVLPSGLKILITKQGDGIQPKKGDVVKVDYSGYFRTGKMFHSSIGARPFQRPCGVGQLVKGMDEGLLLLKVGSKALLYIPSELAYGKTGAGGVIPPNSDLIFEVELLDVVMKK